MFDIFGVDVTKGLLFLADVGSMDHITQRYNPEDHDVYLFILLKAYRDHVCVTIPC